MPLRNDSQRGAVLVEFALTVSLFLVLVLAIVEFAIVIMDFSRANEMTRALSRMAIVSDPVCDIWNGGCPGAVSTLSCPAGAPVEVTLADVAGNCGGSGGDTTACRMLAKAQGLRPDTEADQVTVSYACSDAGYAERPRPIPLVTVSLRGADHALAFPGMLGLETHLTLPAFETSRTGEDLYTEHQL